MNQLIMNQESVNHAIKQSSNQPIKVAMQGNAGLGQRENGFSGFAFRRARLTRAKRTRGRGGFALPRSGHHRIVASVTEMSPAALSQADSIAGKATAARCEGIVVQTNEKRRNTRWLKTR